MSTTYYDVYHIYYHDWAEDHQVIFVETHEQGQNSGHLFQFHGSVLVRMKYNDEPSKDPESSGHFHKKYQIGRIKQSEYPRVDGICRSLASPIKTTDSGGKRLDLSRPLRKPGEWVADAVTALREAGVLVS